MGNRVLAQQERHGLCDLLLSKGPLQPTLCSGWTATELVAHLFVRERRPFAAPGIVLGGAFGRYTDKVMVRVVKSRGFENLVERVRSGPPLLLRPVDGTMNLLEYFVHHEDLRRGDNTEFEPRDVAAIDEAIWAQTPRRWRLMTRKLNNIDLTLFDPIHGISHIGGGDRPVTISGPASEIALYLSGRRGAASVTIEGDPDAVDELRNGQLGI